MKPQPNSTSGVPAWPGRLRTRWLIGLVVWVSAGVLAGPLQHPKRVVSLYTVDLDPLFKWWSKHQGPRPLASWVHITGSIVGTNALGWIIQGQVEPAARDNDRAKAAAASGQAARRVILRTPPVDDLVEFEELSSKLTTLSVERAELIAQESEFKSREQAVSQQAHQVRRNGARSRVLDQEIRQIKRAESDAQAQQKPLDQQVRELRSRLADYPAKDHFILDCFALDLHGDYDQLPVYDHGQVLK